MAPIRQLSVALRVMAVLDWLAISAMIAPWSVLAGAARRYGFEVGQANPLFHYLARTASGMYVVYGATLWFLASDPQRYSKLIRFLAWLAIVQSTAVLAIDVVEQMPPTWYLPEFFGHLAESVILLFLLRRANLPSRPSS